jgi:hypothetical protein
LSLVKSFQRHPLAKYQNISRLRVKLRRAKEVGD